ncbi:MAG: NYN domain-containing protein [Candidatus Omnitrophota bacterium]|jgi:predicted RNA-binding protein with PIN domain
MSLLYIIDAYNIINHPAFSFEKNSPNIQRALLNFIQKRRLTGSPKNKIILVFDGYPPDGESFPQDNQALFVFSRVISADQKIEKLVAESAARKNIIVVTDDRQVQFMARSLHANTCAVAQFSGQKKTGRLIQKERDALETKVSFSDAQKINAELKEKWLK